MVKIRMGMTVLDSIQTVSITNGDHSNKFNLCLFFNS